MSDDEYSSDSTDGGVEEEKTPISLEYKKTKLFQSATTEPQQKQHANVGKLNKWEPVSTRYFLFHMKFGVRLVIYYQIYAD